MNKQEQYFRELKSFFWENNMPPDEFQLERLAYFASIITKKNEELNLISRSDVKNIVENHIFLSCLIKKFFQYKFTKFLDIGTGGGFPGIPFAITSPMTSGVLVDSIAKKTTAVQEFVDKLKLLSVKVENMRVESPEFIAKYKESFDLIISRATVPVIILVRYSLPIIKERAFILAIKGGDLQAEIKTAEIKYKAHIKKATTFEMAYKPSNIRNEKDKKLVMLELIR
ncbi:MAG: 16S rRNA (guanine(527)-N(7))-methyltransferase RsmG [Ignavibacteriales bacterium CG_4_9_14_3_um_filter_34_10]|nr:MAG: 16S rRNA (guanine(527)-N(7))-methyltransferase RsmG [Ignavibacteriales bacterium CG_4_9_14_3_um_filter_34_10]